MKGFVKVISIHRYMEYIVDIFYSYIYFRILGRYRNITIGHSYKVRGVPIISIVNNSYLKIGDSAYIISRSKDTALGVNHPMIIRTMKHNAKISIGNLFSASGATICCAQSVQIGNRVMLGANVVIADTDFHSLNIDHRYKSNDIECAKSSPIIIEDNVFVGMNSIILKGVTIGKGAIIGAGSVVTKNVDSNTIVGGNPATVIKYIY